VIRLAFVGTGWIGLNRMQALLATGKAEAVAVCDPDAAMAGRACEIAPAARLCASLDETLSLRPDGVVIATPNALHAPQCIAALERGAAVFCQKPLGRTAAEVEAILAAAGVADRLLGVDLSYRHTAAMQAIRGLVERGDLGQLFAADLVFHNAYGPGSGWFWDPELSGGGCLLDLGVHLVDLALWLFDFPEVAEAKATLLRDGGEQVEHYASASIELASGASIRLACSWNLPAGHEAVIRASFYGSGGGAEMRNVEGSFYDFTAERFNGRDRETLVSPPDEWGGRAAVDWLQRLANGERFAGTTTGLLQTARVLDRHYGRASPHKGADTAQTCAAQPTSRIVELR